MESRSFSPTYTRSTIKRNAPDWLRGAANQGQHHYYTLWVARVNQRIVPIFLGRIAGEWKPGAQGWIQGVG